MVKTDEKLLKDLTVAIADLNNVMEAFTAGQCHDLCADLMLVEEWYKHNSVTPINTMDARLAVAAFNTAKGKQKGTNRAKAKDLVSTITSAFRTKLNM